MADDRLYSGRGGDHLPKMSFVEVADTRVSRLHCVIKLAAPTDCAQALQAFLEDHSSNGTYVDDVKVKSGESVPLSSGCKVSLVRSVTPWVERCFTFWEGMPTSGSIATACWESMSLLQAVQQIARERYGGALAVQYSQHSGKKICPLSCCVISTLGSTALLSSSGIGI